MKPSTYTLNMWQRIAYGLAFGLAYTVSLLPFWLLYFLSDIIYLLTYYVASYRKTIVRKNLQESFPEKDTLELRRIERRFYHWFCDYMVESIKMFSISEKKMRKHMQFIGLEQFYADVDAGRSITLYLGHYCNWEWISSLGIYMVPLVIGAQLYHPIENKIFDRLFFHMRERFKVRCIDMMEAFQTLVTWEKQGHITVTGYVADQVPGFSSMHYWPQFLNHDTPAYTGTERIARILKTSVYYLDIKRPKRGYYVTNIVKICTDPSTMPKFAITEKFYRLLEQNIKEHPEYWLWSHNRWKRTREEFNALYSEEERKRILSKL